MSTDHTPPEIEIPAGPDWPVGYGRRILAQVDSTNAEAARIAPEISGPEWILAKSQSSARGRRGRAWSMPAGNFAATLVMRPTESPDQVALRSFIAAVALDEAFCAATGRSDLFALKWPNDVLLKGGKVAGILLESAGAAGGTVSHIAIGIGINLAEAPNTGQVEEGAVRPVSLAAETGTRITPEAFLTLLAASYARFEQRFRDYGFEPIRRAWLARAARLGEEITARTMRHEQKGRFETVDAAGNLVLSTDTGRHTIAAAEVFF